MLFRPTQSALLLTGALSILATGACSDPADQAAKARIFSAEEPALDVQRAAESIRVEDAATNADVWERLWKMDRLEVTHRIGAHKAKATVRFKWMTADKTIELTEEQSFETDAEGHFHATVSNSQDAGEELIWVGGKAYARGKYGSFHERRTDRAQQDAVREAATSALPTFFGLYQRRLHGTPAGEGHRGGHTGTRFALALGDPWGQKKAGDAPAPIYGQTRDVEHGPLHPGPDADTQRRLDFDEHEEPTRATGEILVDQTGVILKANLRGRFQMAQKGQPPATLDLDVSYELDSKPAVAIAPPKDVLTLKLPHSVNDPLWFVHGGAASTAAHDEEDEKDTRIEESKPEEDATGGATRTTKAVPPAKLAPPKRSNPE